MKEYSLFVSELKKLKNDFSTKPSVEWKKKAIQSINGLAGSKLRTLISIDERRKSGAFFTSSELVSEVINSYKLSFKENIKFYDPCCGASNLLISVKDHFDLELTKKNYFLEVFGTDIHKEFVEASKLRLIISDMLIGVKKDYIKNILIADGLKPNDFYHNATHIIINPPFNLIHSPFNINWASGKVSAAALFIDATLRYIKPGTEIIAILPDVLRSGSRYEKWRSYISSQSHVSGIKLFGQFDIYTDVDIFSVLLKKKEIASEEKVSPWISASRDKPKVSDLFNISVGSVVDNRDLHNGLVRPYIISKGLEGWVEYSKTQLKRKHEGKSVKAPFVVIKRTSRLGDSKRAIATIVTIPEPVYVDNHLIVLQPKCGGITECRRLLKLLKTQRTDKWIDGQIRCRHLTVKVVSNIPL